MGFVAIFIWLVACLAMPGRAEAAAPAQSAAHAQGSAAPAAQQPRAQEARDIFKELIEIDTTHDAGSTTPAADAMAARLKAAGFAAADVQVIGLEGSKNANLVARLRGTGARRPILLLAHLDVVAARREDWSSDPFILLEKDGYFYGRGTLDIKDGAAILTTALLRLKREPFRPDRDLILALTAGEEAGGDYNGVEWLLKEHRDLIDAEFCINMDAGDPQSRNGKRISRTVQASEKISVSFRLEVRNAGGHSSQPSPDNAIYRLAAGLGRLSALQLPARLNEVTRAYFERSATVETGPLAADLKAVATSPPDAAAIKRLSESTYYNALLRTTCVPTLLEGGHAINALPQMAAASVNCRMLPDEKVDDVEQAIRKAVDDPQVAVTRLSDPKPSPSSPLVPEVAGVIERTTAKLWPGLPVIPEMETGATDGHYLRTTGIPTYGVSGVFMDINENRAHGRDERIGVQDYYDGADYITELVRAFATPPTKGRP